MREMLVLVDADDRIVGSAPRSACHGQANLIHRAVHVLVYNSHKELYLQKRHESKLIQPGKWDSSVGGHLSPGESYRMAALRETREELGFYPGHLTFLFTAQIRNKVESENIRCYSTIFDGKISPNADEISDGRFWAMRDIKASIPHDVFTPAFVEEIGPLLAGI